MGEFNEIDKELGLDVPTHLQRFTGVRVIRDLPVGDQRGRVSADELEAYAELMELAVKKIQELYDYADRLGRELAKHGWGDFHYSSELSQDQAVKALIDERPSHDLPLL